MERLLKLQLIALSVQHFIEEVFLGNAFHFQCVRHLLLQFVQIHHVLLQQLVQPLHPLLLFLVVLDFLSSIKAPSLRILELILELPLFLQEFVLLIFFLFLEKHPFDVDWVYLCIPVFLQPLICFLVQSIHVGIQEASDEPLIRRTFLNFL